MKDKITGLLEEAGKAGINWSDFPYDKDYASGDELREDVSKQVLKSAAGYLVDHGARIVETGHWANVQETESYSSGRASVTTRQTCSVCGVTTRFKGKKKELHDAFCPNCGAMLKKMNKKEK